MPFTRVTLSTLALFVISLAFTASAQAQPQRTFVSAQGGDDANTVNNCSVTKPCRKFDAAVGVVQAGGEVVALDSGGYGPVTINKAVTLTGPTGVYVAITAQDAGTNAVDISTAAGDVVVLRGLTLTGLGGAWGINVTSVGVLYVENCVISGFTSDGINVLLSFDARIYIKDTVLRNNGDNGIEIFTGNGTVRVFIDRTRSERNDGRGFLASSRSRVTISNSSAAGNGFDGFQVFAGGAGVSSQLTAENCVSSDNGSDGFKASSHVNGTSLLRVSRSVANNNDGAGFRQTGANLFEVLQGTNLVVGNGTNIVGTITVVSGI